MSDSSLLGVDDGTPRPHLNSRCLRELSCGKFIIKSEEITQLENIGQGNIFSCVLVYICRYTVTRFSSTGVDMVFAFSTCVINSILTLCLKEFLSSKPLKTEL